MNSSRSSNNSWVFNTLVIIAFLVFFGVTQFSCGALTPESKAIKAAEDAGYTHVVIVDKATFVVGLRGCDEKDNARFTVRGVNTRGETRTFYVCAGVLKGGTVRSR